MQLEGLSLSYWKTHHRLRQSTCQYDELMSMQIMSSGKLQIYHQHYNINDDVQPFNLLQHRLSYLSYSDEYYQASMHVI